MTHPAVYPGDFNALLKEWDGTVKEAWKEHGQAGLAALKIANGECATSATGTHACRFRIWMFDQWNSLDKPKWPSPRFARVSPKAIAKVKKPCDRAEDFYVVLVP
jgi:hypothetical protein